VPAPGERRIPAGRVSLNVRERPGGPPELLCLHGLASNALWWDPLGELLAPRHRVVAVDLRGHGLSDRPERGYGFADVVSDLETLLRQLGLQRPVAVGHSWGASVALELAASASSVSAVVCVDGGVLDVRRVFGSNWEEAEARMRPPQLSGLTEARVRSMVERSGLGEELGEEEATRIVLGNFAEGPNGLTPRLDLRRHMEIAQALYQLDQGELLGRVSCPVLFVMAVNDDGLAEAKRAAVEGARARLTAPSEAVFVRGIHDLPVQRPREVAAAISAFLDRLP
jgi:pimeloyl-ACP methyl ester carboxylesterase